jgi:hypothetical protein
MPIHAKNQNLSFTPIRCQASPVYGANTQELHASAERFGVAAALQQLRPDVNRRNVSL